MKVGLIGCVKQKASEMRPAKDLYTSALFRGRRRWVEQTCDEWWILSALHGVTHPDQPLRPYDVTLNTKTDRARRTWTEMALWQLAKHPWWDCPRGVVFEIHAGAAYIAHGLVNKLDEFGFTVELPAFGLKIGEQLQLYKQGPPVHHNQEVPS